MLSQRMGSLLLIVSQLVLASAFLPASLVSCQIMIRCNLTSSLPPFPPGRFLFSVMMLRIMSLLSCEQLGSLFDRVKLNGVIFFFKPGCNLWARMTTRILIAFLTWDVMYRLPWNRVEIVVGFHQFRPLFRKRMLMYTSLRMVSRDRIYVLVQASVVASDKQLNPLRALFCHL